MGWLWRQLRSEAGGNLVGLLACTAVSQACGLGIVLLSAQHLGPGGLGMLLFALTVTGYLALVGGAGAGQVLIREVASKREKTDAHITAYLMLSGGMTLAMTLLSTAAVLLWAEGEERTLWLFLLAGNLAGSVSLLPLFDAQHRQARAAAVAAVVDMLAVGTCAALAWSDGLTVGLAGMVVAGKWLLTFAGQLATYHWTVRRLRWERAGAEVGLFASSGLKLLAAYVLMLVPLNGGVVLTRLLRTPEETAVIGLATQVAMVYFLLCWQMIRVAQPHIAGPHGEEPWFVRRLVLGLGTMFVGTAALVLAGATVVLWRMLPEYKGAVVPAMTLVGAGVVTGIGLVFSAYLQRRNNEEAILAGQSTGCVGFLVSAGSLIAGLGMNGITIASLLSTTACACLLGFACIRRMGSRDAIPQRTAMATINLTHEGEKDETSGPRIVA